jgi:hypothetical protein
MKVKQADARQIRNPASPAVYRTGDQKEHEPVALQEPVQLEPPPPVPPPTQ